jgi:hypothetical protein
MSKNIGRVKKSEKPSRYGEHGWVEFSSSYSLSISDKAMEASGIEKLDENQKVSVTVFNGFFGMEIIKIRKEYDD